MKSYSRHVYWGLIFGLIAMAILNGLMMVANIPIDLATLSWLQESGFILGSLKNSILLMLVVIALLYRSGAAVWLFGFSAFQTIVGFSMAFEGARGSAFALLWSAVVVFTVVCGLAFRRLIKVEEIAKP